MVTPGADRSGLHEYPTVPPVSGVTPSFPVLQSYRLHTRLLEEEGYRYSRQETRKEENRTGKRRSESVCFFFKGKKATVLVASFSSTFCTSTIVPQEARVGLPSPSTTKGESMFPVSASI